MQTGCPHRVQGTLSSGFKSPGMNTLARQLPHSTIRNGFRSGAGGWGSCDSFVTTAKS
jgi:hypothetical protein